MLRTLRATRYVTPLREGGSLPAIIEADDDGLYVLKFTGSGQGRKALIAEIISGELARAIGLRIPEIVLVELDPALGRNEPDYEIRELLTKSAGINLALDYLPGSITFDPKANSNIDPMIASRIVWLDALTTNVDRTARNANMLMWHKNLWLIDHGASLYFHHQWKGELDKSKSPFTQIKDHVLLKSASQLKEADTDLRGIVSKGLLEQIVAEIPEVWLPADSGFENVNAHRAAYVSYLLERVSSSEIFLTEAENARAKLV